MTTENKNGAYGWDDAVETQDTKTAILPEGEALFCVRSFKKVRKDFGSFGVINVAVLTLDVQSLVNNQTGTVQTQIGLHHDLDWKVTRLFTAVGHRQPGDNVPLFPQWTKLEGEQGFCKIKHRAYHKNSDPAGVKSGITHDVAEFLPPRTEPEAPVVPDDNLAF